MSLFQILTQCKSHTGLETIKTQMRVTSTCTLSKLLNQGFTNVAVFKSKVNHPPQHFNCALAENRWNQVNRIKKTVLTTVQQRGQNHHRRARASSRKRIRRAIKRMVPVSCKQDDYFWVTFVCLREGRSPEVTDLESAFPHYKISGSLCSQSLLSLGHKTREASPLYSPLDSRKLNLHITHSGQVPYYSEWHCKLQDHKPSGVQSNLSFWRCKCANADIQRMGTLELRPYGYLFTCQNHGTEHDLLSASAPKPACAASWLKPLIQP